VSEGRLGRRLRRILVLLPYAIRHPGVSVDELSRRFGVSKKDVIGDLELAFVCGLPGYGPGDLIDVAIEQDRVYVGMADYFASPLRLTPAEGVTLYAAGQAMTSLADMERAHALRRALSKLGRALGAPDEDGEPEVRFTVQPDPAGHLAQLRDALRAHRRVRLEYLSASRGELTAREVDPWGLIVALGRTYLVGLDGLSGEERMFRTDRIKSVEISERPAPIPTDFDPTAYERAFVERGDEKIVSFEISPVVARWFADYYPLKSAVSLDDSWTAVELVSGTDRWAAALVLQLGREVRAVHPSSVADAARAMAAAIATAHGAHDIQASP
jgi:proteasome accessory factor C